MLEGSGENVRGRGRASARGHHRVETPVTGTEVQPHREGAGTRDMLKEDGGIFPLTGAKLLP